MQFTETQTELIRKYLKSSVFYGNKDDAKKFLSASKNLNNKSFNTEGNYVCSYKGLFGFSSKVKYAAYFGVDAFYYRHNSNSNALIIKYDDIKSVSFSKGDKEGVVYKYSSEKSIVPKLVAQVVKGIDIIKSSNTNSDNNIGTYLLSMQEIYFGEYQTINIRRLFENYFSRLSVLDFITFRCSLVELSLNKAVFKITIKDKDFDLFNSNEWEKGINTFSTRRDILEKIQKELSSKLCTNFPMDAINFISRYKSTISRSISKGAVVASDIASNVETVVKDNYQRTQKEVLRKVEREIRLKENIANNDKGLTSDQKKEITDEIEKLKSTKKQIRRTDEELSKDKSGIETPAESYQRNENIPLSCAMNQASNEPGVYILWLNGNVMKCGRSSQFGGVRKRLLEYYRLDYDKKAKAGEYWAVTFENRDNVMVSWQCCPISKCHELEYKLFQKYGKGPWAHRAPSNFEEDTWELLI